MVKQLAFISHFQMLQLTNGGVPSVRLLSGSCVPSVGTRSCAALCDVCFLTTYQPVTYHSVTYQPVRTSHRLPLSCCSSSPFIGRHSISTNNGLWPICHRNNKLIGGMHRTDLVVGNSLTAVGGALQNQRSLTLSAKSIVEASPSSLQPYLRLIRLDRPIGTWLTFLPSAWSLSLAAPVGQLPDVKLICLFGLGAFFMRSAGCTINDMFDKEYDAQVERTKNRPIACGEISRLKALVFLALPLSGSLGILLTLNNTTVILGACALLPVAVYPLMKRVTYWPQAFLGLTFNYGALMGWSAVHGGLDWPVLPLYLSCIAWTLIYDTIYAFQDHKDDILAGVKSTAVRFGDGTKLWLTAFTSVLTTGLVTTGLMCDQPWPYYVGVSLFTAHIAHQILTVDLTNANDCGAKFRSNRNIGLLFWLAIVAASAMGHVTDKRSRDVDETLDSAISDSLSPSS